MLFSISLPLLSLLLPSGCFLSMAAKRIPTTCSPERPSPTHRGLTTWSAGQIGQREGGMRGRENTWVAAAVVGPKSEKVGGKGKERTGVHSHFKRSILPSLHTTAPKFTAIYFIHQWGLGAISWSYALLYQTNIQEKCVVNLFTHLQNHTYIHLTGFGPEPGSTGIPERKVSPCY